MWSLVIQFVKLVVLYYVKNIFCKTHACEVSDTARMEDTVLTAMVPVDPFQLPQEEPLALTVGKEPQEQEQEKEQAPSFTLQLLVLEEGELLGGKSPLTDASNNQMR